MWLLGAGASAGAGIPTASNMIWDFKRTLYAAREKVSLRALSDLGDPAIRLRLQQYFDRIHEFPPENDPEEYAFYFEAAYPNEQDRRRYIQAEVEGASPSFGHFTLAVLMKADRLRVTWTTNFDRLVEDAAAEVFGTTGRLVVAALGEPDLARDAINSERWPFLGKVHGDFHSLRLRNISAELRVQDVHMRESLIESCRRFGLVVAGYSGRDDSIMDALTEALQQRGSFPFGLFWFHRGEGPLLPRVDALIVEAQRSGIEAAAIPIETFDELTTDLLLLEPELPRELTSLLDSKSPRRTTYLQPPRDAGTWPVLRLNAFPMTRWPSTCRLIRCDIGGTNEVRQAIMTAGVNVIAARRQAGVICFGSDEDITRAFSPYQIKEHGLYAIEPGRLRYESADKGLLYEAIGRGFTRESQALRFVASARKLVVDPAQAAAQELSELRRVLGNVAGSMGRSEVLWSEALFLRLEYRLGQLWLLIEPTVWIHRDPEATPQEEAGEFVRQRLAIRYNRKWNDVLDAWIAVLFGNQKERGIRALGISDGIDAVFAVSAITTFSRRIER